MNLQFFLVFQAKGSVQEGARWVDDPKEIRRHYMRGWFSIDLVSIVPFEYAPRYLNP